MSRNKPRPPKVERAGLDIVVTTAGRFDVLRVCLDTLAEYAKITPFNVLVIDNGSDAEESRQNADLFFRANNPYFKSKRLTQNVGFPAAANEGARMGNAPLIMFLSDDVKLTEGAIEKVVSDFQDPAVGIVGIKLLFPEDSTAPNRPAGRVQHVGLDLNIRGEPIHPLIGWGKNHPKTCISREAWAVTGACLTIRRDLFNKAGGFNQIYGKGTFEDCDLCLTVRGLGGKIYIDTQAVGYHHVGATAEKRQEAFPIQQNLMIFRSRWQATNLLQWGEWTYW